MVITVAGRRRIRQVRRRARPTSLGAATSTIPPGLRGRRIVAITRPTPATVPSAPVCSGWPPPTTTSVSEGADGVLRQPDSTPRVTVLHGAYPNPFNPSTSIRYDLAQAGDVQLNVYSITGQLVRHL